MNKFLEVPVVLHWDMRQSLKNKQVIEKKIREFPFAKIRLLYPETCEDWEFVKHIIASKNNVSKFQVEFELNKYKQVQEFIGNTQVNNVELLPIYTQECSDMDLWTVLHYIDKKYDILYVGFYINKDNADEYIDVLEKYHHIQKLNFCVKLDKENYNSLCQSFNLHTIIEKLSQLYIKYPGIKLSFYDDEKIIKDIFYLPYYYYGNAFLNRYGMIALYDFLPAYDYGFTDTDVGFKEVWNALISEHGYELEKILEYPRYWLKRRMELKNEDLFHRNI